MSRPDKVLVRTRREGAAVAPLQQQVGSLARSLAGFTCCGAVAALSISATRRLADSSRRTTRLAELEAGSIMLLRAGRES